MWFNETTTTMTSMTTTTMTAVLPYDDGLNVAKVCKALTTIAFGVCVCVCVRLYRIKTIFLLLFCCFCFPCCVCVCIVCFPKWGNSDKIKLYRWWVVWVVGVCVCTTYIVFAEDWPGIWKKKRLIENQTIYLCYIEAVHVYRVDVLFTSFILHLIYIRHIRRIYVAQCESARVRLSALAAYTYFLSSNCIFRCQIYRERERERVWSGVGRKYCYCNTHTKHKHKQWATGTILSICENIESAYSNGNRVFVWFFFFVFLSLIYGV